MQCLRVQVATGLAYWTVVDDDYLPVVVLDAFLRHARLGRGRAEGTTENYARALSLFWQWKSVRDLATAASDLDGFALRIRTEVVTAGRAKGATRSPQRVNLILIAVREFYKHAVAHGSVDGKVLARLYEVCDDRHLPAQLRPEGRGLSYVARPRHKLRAPRPVSPMAATTEDVEALLSAAGLARDRLLVGVMAFCGLRVGGALSLRRCAAHLMERSSVLGCQVAGPHLHVPATDAFPGAATKGDGYTIPVPEALLVLFELHAIERDQHREAAASDWLFANYSGPRPGGQLQYQSVYELFGRLSRRAGLARSLTPHMLRHGLATDLVDNGVGIAVIQRVLGHHSITSTQVYARPSTEALRAAVDAGARRLEHTILQGGLS
jgi:integrase/recombinase XerD